MRIEVVNFDGDYVALVKEQDDWTGNYKSSLRLIHGECGEEFIRYNGRRISVRGQLNDARFKDDSRRSLEKEVKELRKLVSRY